MINEIKIRVKPQDSCVLCGTKGRSLYGELKDSVFGIVSGTWGLSQCENKSCRLAWLNPMPLTEEIGLAYKGYYTHAEGRKSKQGLFGAIYNKIKNGYLATRYGYRTSDVRPLYKLLGFGFYLLPIRRGRLDYPFNVVSFLNRGKLLEIGCGAGTHLSTLKDLGWDVKGIDFDNKAVEKAVVKNLDVVCGDLFSQDYKENEFDVILMHHVLEHLPNPVDVVRECRRILKNSGHLILVTPNMGSLGRKIYGSDWRGLEVPRHLYLYDKNALHKLIIQASYNSSLISTLPIRGMYTLHSSAKIKSKNSLIRAAYFFINYVIFVVEIVADKVFAFCVAEEIMLVAKK